MNEMPDLRTALLDLLYETRDQEMKLILGGGYGILLKREYIRSRGLATLLAEWPEARSTNDLDLFLRPELLIDSTRLKPLAEALPRLGYKVIKGAEKFQFARPGPAGDRQGSFKIDLLTGPRSRFANSKVKVDDRRVQPRPSIDLHAHHTDEAITLEDGLLAVAVEGITSASVFHRGEVYLLHPFTFAMMKLFAFRDRNRDADKKYGRYHALDLYSVVAMMTEAEWDEALGFAARFMTDHAFVEACGIVEAYFVNKTSEGNVRMRESPYFRKELALDQFIAALGKLFPANTIGTSPS